jgi:hypothetical protein
MIIVLLLYLLLVATAAKSLGMLIFLIYNVAIEN